jgi:hypothetical protein
MCAPGETVRGAGRATAFGAWGSAATLQARAYGTAARIGAWDSCRRAARVRVLTGSVEWLAAKQARFYAGAGRCTQNTRIRQQHPPPRGLPGFGCAMSAVKRRAGPRPIRVFSVYPSAFALSLACRAACRTVAARGAARCGVGSRRCASWCMRVLSRRRGRIGAGVLPAPLSRRQGGLNWCMGFWPARRVRGPVAAACGSWRSKRGFTGMQADRR